MIIGVYTGSLLIFGMILCQINEYYLHNPSVATAVVWAHGGLPKNWPCSLGCFYNRQLQVEETIGMPMELVTSKKPRGIPRFDIVG